MGFERTKKQDKLPQASSPKWVSELFYKRVLGMLNGIKSYRKRNSIHVKSSHQKAQSGELPEVAKIIGSPTNVEHSIHIEYNNSTGRFMGVPDVWKGSVPYDDLINTKGLDPNLIPVVSENTPKVKCLGISRPFNVNHDFHVDLDSFGSFSLSGLPGDWVQKLTSSGFQLNSLSPITPKPPFACRSESALAVASNLKNSYLMSQESISTTEIPGTIQQSILEKALIKAAQFSPERDASRLTRNQNKGLPSAVPPKSK
ncbi:hypothetical protein DSO57_1001778 [Entomophthora muscae]|uniref:Uncharacterized protein n=1 Tax=Entomophthora muscae TaxID=34485 RepID=A0ACC2T8Q5_9FUNG|nr:hypothetical protein DSO57_1001778 [Entomophthora muscae]